jgi:flagellar L-ring protein precursor FlgH
MRAFLTCLLTLTMVGCATLESTPPTAIHQPMSAVAKRPVEFAPANGAIFQAHAARPLFEDRRARLVGDTITINLVENTSAQKASNASAGRESSISGGIDTLNKMPFKNLAGLSMSAGTSNDFEGSGAAAANNLFRGTITVTVIEVFPNGNLLVSGEKQVAINQGDEFIRFSGVVNPTNVTTSNTVQSTQVADARMEYKGSGYINDSQVMGWLQRFFIALLPI